MYELLYESQSCKAMSPEDLEKLLVVSRDKNRSLGVTGMLVYHQREFLQVLEGERDTVLTLFDRIIQDERHHWAYVLKEGEIEERGFDLWSMGFLDTRSDSAAFKDGYSRFLADGLLTASNRNPTVCKGLLFHLRTYILKMPDVDFRTASGTGR